MAILIVAGGVLVVTIANHGSDTPRLGARAADTTSTTLAPTTTTGPSTAPTTLPAIVGDGSPRIVSASVSPEEVQCPRKVGATARVTVDWQTANTKQIIVYLVTPAGYQKLGESADQVAQLSVAIPCTGQQQHIAFITDFDVAGHPQQDLYVDESFAER